MSATQHWSTHAQWEQDKTEYQTMAKIDNKKAKLDNKLLQNIQDIKLSQNFYRENHKNLENWIDSKTKKLSWSDDPERYIPGWYTITTTLRDCMCQGNNGEEDILELKRGLMHRCNDLKIT